MGRADFWNTRGEQEMFPQVKTLKHWVESLRGFGGGVQSAMRARVQN